MDKKCISRCCVPAVTAAWVVVARLPGPQQLLISTGDNNNNTMQQRNTFANTQLTIAVNLQTTFIYFFLFSSSPTIKYPSGVVQECHYCQHHLPPNKGLQPRAAGPSCHHSRGSN